MLHITYTAQARKALKKIPHPTAKRILTALEKLADDPARDDLNVKKLKGRDGYRLRIGDWRILYTADGIVLSVERIGPRGDIYKGA